MFFLNEKWYYILYEHADSNGNKAIIFFILLSVVINIFSKLFYSILWYL